MMAKTFYSIQFTRSGWKQLNKANSKLGARFIRAIIVKNDLSAYLSAHEAAGITMDTECQEVRYDDGIYLLLHKSQGEWYITDVILSDAPDAFLPVYIVRNVLRGLFSVIELVFSGWRAQYGQSSQKVVFV